MKANWKVMEKKTFGGILVISKYPPRCPHSPQYPLETVWKEISWTSLLIGGPISNKTFHCNQNKQQLINSSWTQSQESNG